MQRTITLPTEKNKVICWARQGEHNQSQIVVNLPEDMSDCYSCRVTLKAGGHENTDFLETTPTDGQISFLLPVAATEHKGTIGLQVTCYNSDSTIIGKTPVYAGIIAASLYEAEEEIDTNPSAYEQLLALITQNSADDATRVQDWLTKAADADIPFLYLSEYQNCSPQDLADLYLYCHSITPNTGYGYGGSLFYSEVPWGPEQNGIMAIIAWRAYRASPDPLIPPPHTNEVCPVFFIPKRLEAYISYFQNNAQEWHFEDIYLIDPRYRNVHGEDNPYDGQTIDYAIGDMSAEIDLLGDGKQEKTITNEEHPYYEDTVEEALTDLATGKASGTFGEDFGGYIDTWYHNESGHIYSVHEMLELVVDSVEGILAQGLLRGDDGDGLEMESPEDGQTTLYTDLQVYAVAVRSAIDQRQPKPSIITQYAPSAITLADNTEYRLTDVANLTITYPSENFEVWIKLTTAASGTVTITLPSSSYIGATPTFGNGETWELSIKDGVVIAQQVVTPT